MHIKRPQASLLKRTMFYHIWKLHKKELNVAEMNKLIIYESILWNKCIHTF